MLALCSFRRYWAAHHQAAQKGNKNRENRRNGEIVKNKIISPESTQQRYDLHWHSPALSRTCSRGAVTMQKPRTKTCPPRPRKVSFAMHVDAILTVCTASAHLWATTMCQDTDRDTRREGTETQIQSNRKKCSNSSMKWIREATERSVSWQRMCYVAVGCKVILKRLTNYDKNATITLTEETRSVVGHLLGPIALFPKQVISDVRNGTVFGFLG